MKAAYCIDPFHVCGNAAKLEYRTIRFFFTEAKISFVLSSSLATFPQTITAIVMYMYNMYHTAQLDVKIRMF